MDIVFSDVIFGKFIRVGVLLKMQQAKQLAAEGSYDNLPRAPGSDKEHIDWLQKQITELHETYKILYQRNVSLSNDLAHALV